MTQPDTINVQVSETRDIAAEHADLYVTITGRSLVTGQAALQKAIEVKQLVQSLQRIRLDESNIFLEGISANIETGLISKTSAAIYHLRVHCPNLEQLADILGVITDQKNTQITTIAWGYRDLSSKYDALLEQGLLKLQQQASRIAGALGLKLLGVYELNHTISDPEAPVIRQQSYTTDTMMLQRRRMTAEDLGLEVSHTKTVTLTIAARYRVSAFG